MTEEKKTTEQVAEKKAPSKKAATKKAATKKVKDPNKIKLKKSEKLHGKKYRAIESKINKDKKYSISEAIQLALDTSTTKFDGSVEIHINTSADQKKADQMIRSSLTLPHGTGKDVRVAVFCSDEYEKACKAAGAIEAGADELIGKIIKGFTDFDVAVATPDMMKELAKVAKVLGPKGLMPSPKAGTVSKDPAKTVEELRKGKMEYRADSFGIVHSAIGKISFGAEKITDNLEAFLKTIQTNRPTGIKGNFIKSVYLTTSMGPSVCINEKEI